MAELNQLSTGLQQVAGQLAPVASQYTDASQKLIKARAALRLLDASVSIQPEVFGLASATAESARAAEAEAAATRDALRHLLREVAAALNRRMQLALSIRLSASGESGAHSITPERVQELVTALNQAADDYAKHYETMDALAVFDQVAAIKKSAGETPALSQALEVQKKTVNSFIMEPPEETRSVAPKPGLQLAKRQNYQGPGEFESLRQKTLQWFVDYQKMTNQLAEIAHAVEKIPA